MVKAGGTNTKPNGRGFDFYQVHWMVYPLTNWLTMLANASCLTPESFDIFMLSEFEITWNDDEASSLFHPEVFLFTSVPAQAACATDCVAASAGFPLDFLFWCSGCNGSTYPWSGSVSSGQSGIQSSVLVSQRMHSKLHRTFVALDYGSTASMCYPIPMPIIPKSHYKTQMIYPIPETQFANPYGRTTAMWGAGRNFPVSGEDFSYVIFRKRVCCAF
jgi:conjugal transfer pilus assembly protein TraU